MWTSAKANECCATSGTDKPPEGVVLGSGTGQKCVSSPANGRKSEVPPPAAETPFLGPWDSVSAQPMSPSGDPQVHVDIGGG
jgi:hypothetical protein